MYYVTTMLCGSGIATTKHNVDVCCSRIVRVVQERLITVVAIDNSKHILNQNLYFEQCCMFMSINMASSTGKAEKGPTDVSALIHNVDRVGRRHSGQVESRGASLAPLHLPLPQTTETYIPSPPRCAIRFHLVRSQPRNHKATVL